MKTIILNSKSEQQNFMQHGTELLAQLKDASDVVICNEVQSDFSNVPDLFDETEKLVLFNQFALKEGFSALTQYLPLFKNVKYLLSPYSAYNGLDLELIRRLGIRYRNNAGANARSVAQYAVTSMFMLLTKFPILSKLETAPDGSVLGAEYYQKTAGIIGMGNVGQELLNILNKLGIQNVYYNRTKKDVEAKLVSLEEIFEQDIVFISIATNPDTIALLDKIPSLMQPHNYIVDTTAMDDLYKKSDVLDLLNNNQINGYSVDFFRSVPVSFKSDKNLIATPHIAWCTVDAEERKIQNYLGRALRILRGEIAGIDFVV